MSWSLAETDQRTCRVSSALGIQPCPLQLPRGPPKVVWFIVADMCHCTRWQLFLCSQNSFLARYVPFNSREGRTPFLLKLDKFTTFLETSLAVWSNSLSITSEPACTLADSLSAWSFFLSVQPSRLLLSQIFCLPLAVIIKSQYKIMHHCFSIGWIGLLFIPWAITCQVRGCFLFFMCFLICINLQGFSQHSKTDRYFQNICKNVCRDSKQIKIVTGLVESLQDFYSSSVCTICFS